MPEWLPDASRVLLLGSATTAMRIVCIEVGYDYLMQLLQGHELSKVITNIPADARIVGVGASQNRRVALLNVESASFAEVPEYNTIPAFNPTVTVSVTETSMLADLVSRRHDEIAEENQKLREILTANGISW